MIFKDNNTYYDKDSYYFVQL